MTEEMTMLEVQRSMGRIEGKVDSLLMANRIDAESIAKLETRHLQFCKEVDGRLGRLENWRNFLTGAYAFGALVFGGAWALLAK